MILKFICMDEINAIRMAKKLLKRGRRVAVYKRMVISEIEGDEYALLQCQFRAYTETINSWDLNYLKVNNLIF